MVVAVCRAVRVRCVAEDDQALAARRTATVSAEWELTPGATDETTALALIGAERPHVLVAFGPYDHLVSITRTGFPGMRIVTDRDLPGATVVATSMEEVRGLVMGLPRPGGPVRS
jgi:hypothetical protein